MGDPPGGVWRLADRISGGTPCHREHRISDCWECSNLISTWNTTRWNPSSQARVGSGRPGLQARPRSVGCHRPSVQRTEELRKKYSNTSRNAFQHFSTFQRFNIFNIWKFLLHGNIWKKTTIQRSAKSDVKDPTLVLNQNETWFYITKCSNIAIIFDKNKTDNNIIFQDAWKYQLSKIQPTFTIFFAEMHSRSRFIWA